MGFHAEDSSGLNYSAIAALAAASRALKEYDTQLAAEALSVAESAWEKERKEPPPAQCQDDAVVLQWCGMCGGAAAVRDDEG